MIYLNRFSFSFSFYNGYTELLVENFSYFCCCFVTPLVHKHTSIFIEVQFFGFFCFEYFFLKKTTVNISGFDFFPVFFLVSDNENGKNSKIKLLTFDCINVLGNKKYRWQEYWTFIEQILHPANIEPGGKTKQRKKWSIFSRVFFFPMD